MTYEDLLVEMREMEACLYLDFETKGETSNQLYTAYQQAKKATDEARDKVNNIVNAISSMERSIV